ncbi:MAG: DUF188 domain-containing protein, partial [Treponemataceae bacterium]|nr:DUF188 domain-containing protein [Treponemataceae bacterium]
GSSDVGGPRDIPLAARLAGNGIAVINDRGTAFTADIIRKKMEDRAFDLQLSRIGLGGARRSTYSAKEFAQFADCFDRTLRRLGALQPDAVSAPLQG